MCVNFRNSFSSAISKKITERNRLTVQLKRFFAYSLYLHSLLTFSYRSLTLITNQSTKQRKSSNIHFYQTDMLHCGNTLKSLEQKPYQATLAIRETGLRENCQLLFTCSKVPYSFLCFLSWNGGGEGEGEFKSLGSDFWLKFYRSLLQKQLWSFLLFIHTVDSIAENGL